MRFEISKRKLSYFLLSFVCCFPFQSHLSISVRMTFSERLQVMQMLKSIGAYGPCQTELAYVIPDSKRTYEEYTKFYLPQS